MARRPKNAGRSGGSARTARPGRRAPRSPEIVVIGASSGGTDAVATVLGGLPLNFAAPVVVALHRAAQSDGLAALVSRRSGRLVEDAEDKQPLVTGRFVLAPADYHLLVDRERLLLSVDPPVRHARPSVDVLFETAAEAYGAGVVAVVLTGMNRDGAAGAAAVKRCGGLLVVQDPAGAEQAEMPQAALDAAAADHVLPLDEIGPLLAGLFEERAEVAGDDGKAEEVGSAGR